MKSRIVIGGYDWDSIADTYNPKSLVVEELNPPPQFIGVYDADGSPLYRVYEKERIGYVITD